jgi:hypothetical protein
VRQPPLGEDVRQEVRHTPHAVQGVVPQAVEEWEDGSRRDASPAEEVAFWRSIAEAYTHLRAGRPLSPEQKRDLLDVIFACLNNGPEYTLLTTRPTTLSPDEVKEVAAYLERKARG